MISSLSFKPFSRTGSINSRISDRTLVSKAIRSRSYRSYSENVGSGNFTYRLALLLSPDFMVKYRLIILFGLACLL